MKLPKFKLLRLTQLKNMPFNSVTFDVSKPDISRSVKLSQLSNMLPMSVTFDVSKELKFRSFRLRQLLNNSIDNGGRYIVP